MTCPICNKHKAKRLCPAKAETICPSCCGREREVTIDCPSDCTYLIASREFDSRKKEFDWGGLPHPELQQIARSIENHETLISYLLLRTGQYASEHRPLVDADAQASLQALAETYRTLSSGIYFERHPDYSLQRELYGHLKEAIGEFKREQKMAGALYSIRDFEVRDCLTFLGQLAVVHSNGRPKGRAFLDFIRSQFPPEQFAKASSSSIVLP